MLPLWRCKSTSFLSSEVNMSAFRDSVCTFIPYSSLCQLHSDWEGKGPCTIVPLTWKMAHKSLCRMIRNGPLKISKSLKKAENGPFGKNLFPITAITYRFVGHDRCKLTGSCKRFPICDDKTTENDRCVIKIIGMHCYTSDIRIYDIAVFLCLFDYCRAPRP